MSSSNSLFGGKLDFDEKREKTPCTPLPSRDQIDRRRALARGIHESPPSPPKRTRNKMFAFTSLPSLPAELTENAE